MRCRVILRDWQHIYYLLGLMKPLKIVLHQTPAQCLFVTCVIMLRVVLLLFVLLLLILLSSFAIVRAVLRSLLAISGVK